MRREPSYLIAALVAVALTSSAPTSAQHRTTHRKVNVPRARPPVAKASVPKVQPSFRLEGTKDYKFPADAILVNNGGKSVLYVGCAGPIPTTVKSQKKPLIACSFTQLRFDSKLAHGRKHELSVLSRTWTAIFELVANNTWERKDPIPATTNAFFGRKRRRATLTIRGDWMTFTVTTLRHDGTTDVASWSSRRSFGRFTARINGVTLNFDWINNAAAPKGIGWIPVYFGY